jgi:hypothetical protein
MPAAHASAPALARRAPSRPTPPFRHAPSPRGKRPAETNGAKPEHEILFQQFFKSVGPRTYAAQVKKANNGNHYVVLTEGQRDEKSGDVHKTRLFVFSEDFAEFFDLVQKAAEFVKSHPLPPEVRRKRERFWAKQAAGADTPSGKPRSPLPARQAAFAAPPRR